MVADPAGCASLAATAEDYLIPSGILGGIVSGLVSRSVLSDALVGEGEFHACRHLTEFAEADQSRAFIAAVEADPALQRALLRTMQDIVSADGVETTAEVEVLARALEKWGARVAAGSVLLTLIACAAPAQPTAASAPPATKPSSP